MLSAASLAAQSVRVPDTRLVMTPPDGFAPAAAFAGFQNEAGGASLIVAEMAGASFAELRESMTPEAFRTQGVEVDTLRDLVVNDAPAFLARGTQEAYGQTYDKWVLVTGDSVGAFVATGAVPVGADRELAAHVEAALLGVSWVARTSADCSRGSRSCSTCPTASTRRTGSRRR